MLLMKLFCHSCLSNISEPTLKPLVGDIKTVVQPPSEHVTQAFLRKVRRVLVVSLNLIQSLYRYTKLHSQLSPFSCYRELHEILQCGGRNSHRSVEYVRALKGGRNCWNSLSQQIGASFQFQYQFRLSYKTCVNVEIC